MKELDLYLYCIAYKCPKINRTKDCPFFEIDHLSFKEKIDWIDELTEKKKQAILKYHIFCTNSVK